MTFAEFGWLWLLSLVPLFYFYFRFDFKKRENTLNDFIDRSFWNKIIPELNLNLRKRKFFLWTLALIFSVFSLARPQWGTVEKTLNSSGLDIFFVLDVSNSMLVEDIVPSRLQKSKRVIRDFLEGLSGDRVGLVSFAGSAYLASPLTTDLDYVKEVIQSVSPKTIMNQGTDIGLALEITARALERGAESAGNEDIKKKYDSKVVILISDGEDLEEKALEGARRIADLGAKLFVLGVGTKKGGPIPVRDEAQVLKGYKKDNSRETVISSFRSESLKKIAERGGGKYFSLSDHSGEVDEILADIGALNGQTFGEKTYHVKEERFQFPLFLTLILILFELGVPSRKMVIGGALAIFTLASPLESFSGVMDSFEVYRKNQKGIEAFENGNFDEAKRNFGSAQALSPDSPELKFNQGVMQMAEQDIDSAVESFNDAIKRSDREGNETLGARARYNLGSALEKKGDVESAVKTLIETLGKAKELGDKKLEEEVRRKLGSIVVQQQKQQQQNNDEKKEKKSSETEKKNQESHESKEREESKPEDQKNRKMKEPDKEKKNNYDGKKLSKEDAERVMLELSNREKELQSKLKNKKGKQGVVGGKDW